MDTIKAYALPLNWDPVASNREYLQQKKYLIEFSENALTPDTLGHLKVGIRQHKITMNHLRVILIFKNRREILIDSLGVVKFENKEHYITPAYYLYLRWTLTNMLYRNQGAKEWTVQVE
jgi:hypothetical protein